MRIIELGFHVCIESVASDLEVSRTAARILLHLIHAPPSTLSHLRRVLPFSENTLALTIDRLLSRGLVEKFPAPLDGRMLLIQATDSCRDAVQLHDLLARALEVELGGHDVALARKFLGSLTRTLHRAGSD
ncbi:MarR family transcriptional regulator [Frondihabitans sp. 4ASC-45]|uniref:MarR family transcriptional regulator n=1 Tax=Frondihabitans sp. 4ASC-45 TaxID=3111636 RepID=UPI003C1C46CB